MKIEKFKESWDENKLNDFQNLKNNFFSTQLELASMLKQYILLNPQMTDYYDDFESTTIVDIEYFKYPHYIYNNKKMKIRIDTENYNVDFTEQIYILEDDFEDLLTFLKNPDAYINSKKYNL